jgi:hypothetical protein
MSTRPSFQTTPRWFVWAVLVGCLLVSFAVFANTFDHAWTYDDYPVIVDNPDVQSVSNFLENRYSGRPIRELTYLVDHSIFGMEPAGWHVQSILWHALAGFLLILLMVRSGLGWLCGCCAGLLFLVHPVTVEAVANISHRKESLTLVFSFLSLLAYRRACFSDGQRSGWLILSLISVCLACLSKQTAAGLPLVMLAYEWSFVDRSRWLLLRWWKVWGGLGLLLTVCGGVWFWSAGVWERYERGMIGLLQFKANYFDTFSLTTYWGTLLKAWAFSASKLILPTGLSAEYVFKVPASWTDPWVLSGLLLTFGTMALLGWLGWSRSPAFPWLTMAILFYLPVTNIWPLAYLAADRYLYAPCAALVMVFVWSLLKIIRPPLLAVLLVVFLAIPLAGMTLRQNQVWASREALWTHAYQVNPTSSFVLNNVGNLAMMREELGVAAGYYQQALEVNPLNPTAWYNLGLIFERRGNLRLALKFYQQFINLNHRGWQKEIATLQQNLLRVYGLRLERGVFDPRLPQP